MSFKLYINCAFCIMAKWFWGLADNSLSRRFKALCVSPDKENLIACFMFRVSSSFFPISYTSIFFCLLRSNIFRELTAKFRFWPPSKQNVATPITSPFELKTGEPLLPCEMGAVICSTFPWVLSSLTAEIIPVETVCSNPNGLPIFTMFSPFLGIDFEIFAAWREQFWVITVNFTRSVLWL